MAQYATLKAAIDAVIKANGQREITGTVLNQTLNAMVNSLGANYQLAGVATPSTNPGTPDQNVFYLAFEAGTYTNFNATVLSAGISILMWNGSWSSQTFYTIDATPTASSNNLVSSGAVFDAIKTDGSAYDVSAHFPTAGPNNDGKFTLEYILSNANTLIPAAWRKGGMSIRFVDISDNKYVQSRCMAQTFTTDVTKWQGVDDEVIAGSQNLIEGGAVAEVIEKELQIERTANLEFSSTGFKMNVFTELPIKAGDTLKVKATSSDAVWDTFYIFGGSEWSGDWNSTLTKGVEKSITIPVDTEIINFRLASASSYGTIKVEIKVNHLIISTDKIVDSAVTTDKIANDAVTASKIADDSVTSGKIADNAIVASKIADGAITKPKIPDSEISTEKIANDAIGNSKIQESAVSINKLSFVESVNLVNKNDKDVALGKFLHENDDNLGSNLAYNTTGFIAVEPNTTYQLQASDKTAYAARFVRLYNASKEGTRTASNVTEIMTDATTAYIRISFYSDYWNYVQATEGTKKIPYQNYNPLIPSSCIKQDTTIPFFLPKNIYVAVGRTIEIYYEQICLNAHKYNIQAVCSIGKALARKFQIIGDSDHIGNYTLTINVYDDNNVVLASGASTIHIVSSVIASSKAIVPFGDSLTNNKEWLEEVPSLSNSMISFIGTRYGHKHEGRSGIRAEFYNSTINPDTHLPQLYTFDHYYTGVGSDAADFSTSVSYAVGDYCKYGNTNPKSVYVFTTAHPAGAWDASHVFNLTETNPLLDWETMSWSYTKYKTRNNISPDGIMLFLGTNGINMTPETNPNGAKGIKELIDKIRLEDATIPIFVIETIFRGNQNGIGSQGNTDGFVAQSTYKFNIDEKVLLLAKALEEMLDGYTNVHIVPCGATMDSEYDYGNVKTQVNPRLTSTTDVYELYPNDSVHPQEVGYLQIADEMFSAFCYAYNL